MSAKKAYLSAKKKKVQMGRKVTFSDPPARSQVPTSLNRSIFNKFKGQDLGPRSLLLMPMQGRRPPLN